MRGRIADRTNLPPYNVLGGQVLKALCKRRPVDLATLSTVDGMAHKKVADYGAEIIKVCVCVSWWAYLSFFALLGSLSQ